MTGITLSEARKRMAKAPRPPLRAGLSPNPGGAGARAPLPVALPVGQITHGVGPVLPAKIFRFAITPNHSYNSRHPVPLEGRIAIVTDVGCGMRWTRQRRARDVFAGRASACERSNGAQTTGA